MPTYTLKDTKTDETFDVICSWDSLQEKLKENPHLEKMVASPRIVSGVNGPRVPDGFKDLTKQIKKGSGRGNTINV
jgi:hypothetical protein